MAVPLKQEIFDFDNNEKLPLLCIKVLTQCDHAIDEKQIFYHLTRSIVIKILEACNEHKNIEVRVRLTVFS